MRKIVFRVALGVLALFVLIQFVPYGRDHSNPAPTKAAAWSSDRGRELASGSCNDCHSDLTEWRWYSNVAPASWLVQSDVEEGRDVLNLSEWDKPQPPLEELIETIQEGEMPPLKYTLPHPSAKLSDSEKQDLIAALRELYSSDPPPVRGG